MAPTTTGEIVGREAELEAAHIVLPVSPRVISAVANDVWVSVAAPNSLP